MWQISSSCSRKCHKYPIPAVGTVLAHHSQGEQNLIFCIQVTWLWSAAGYSRIPKYRARPYALTVRKFFLFVPRLTKRKSNISPNSARIEDSFYRNRAFQLQVLIFDMHKCSHFWNHKEYLITSIENPHLPPPFFFFPQMHFCSLYNMSIMNFLALTLVSSSSGQTWRCLECDKAVLACQLYSVSKFIFFS